MSSLPQESVKTIHDIFNTQQLTTIDPIKSSNAYSFDKYVNYNFNYIKPLQIILGINELGKQHVYHYVPILNSLQSFISHDDVLNEIYRSQSNNKIISNFKDDNYFRNNILFSKNYTALQV